MHSALTEPQGAALRQALIGLAVCGLGAFVLMRARSLLALAREARRRPTTAGLITTSHVCELMDHEGRILHAPEIRYTYTVDDSTYTGFRIGMGDLPGGKSPRAAESLVAQYPLKARVNVYYDPARPNRAVLDPRPALRTRLRAATGALTTLAGFVLLACAIPQAPTQRVTPTPPTASAGAMETEQARDTASNARPRFPAIPPEEEMRGTVLRE